MFIRAIPSKSHCKLSKNVGFMSRTHCYVSHLEKISNSTYNRDSTYNFS